jgi:RHS repeat-associated protein
LELNNNLYTPIRNHRGDICQLLQDQTVVGTYRYDAFGLHTQEGLSSPWMLSGQRYDSILELYHFDKREYDPYLGRWLTPDPLGFADGPNLYAYVHNNPLIYIDPHGLWAKEACDFIGGTARGIVDDTTWNATDCVQGQFQATSAASHYGYHFGMGLSTLAGLCYGNTEAKWFNKRISSLTRNMPKLAREAKTLSETHKITKATTNNSPLKQIFKEVKVAEKPLAKTRKVADKSGSTWFIPDVNASGPHTVFRRDGSTKKISHYESYQPQTNPRDPKLWESVKRFDGENSRKHWNKILQRDIYSPHIHDPYCPGEIREALFWEIPG